MNFCKTVSGQGGGGDRLPSFWFVSIPKSRVVAGKQTGSAVLSDRIPACEGKALYESTTHREQASHVPDDLLLPSALRRRCRGIPLTELLCVRVRWLVANPPRQIDCVPLCGCIGNLRSMKAEEAYTVLRTVAAEISPTVMMS